VDEADRDSQLAGDDVEEEARFLWI